MEIIKNEEEGEVIQFSKEEEEREKLHLIWKKNAPFLYDCLITSRLEWPSLTCQWLPGKEVVSGGEYIEQRLILGI